MPLCTYRKIHGEHVRRDGAGRYSFTSRAFGLVEIRREPSGWNAYTATGTRVARERTLADCVKKAGQ